MAASKAKLDFRGVKDRSNFRTKHLPEGDYPARILAVDDHESDNNKGWVWTIGIVKGPGKGAKYPYYTMHKKSNLWKVRNLLQAAGLTVPKKLLGVDPNKAVGKDIGIILEDDEYEGKTRSQISDVISMADLTGDVDDFDEDEDEELDDDEVEEDSDDEVEDDEDEEDEEEEPEPPKKKRKKKGSKKSKSSDDDEVDDEELEELELEEL